MLLIQICYLLRKVSRLQIESCNAWKVSVFGVLLVRIFPHSDWIQRDIVRMLVNTDKKNSKYGHFSRSVMREPFFSNILLSMFFSQMHFCERFLSNIRLPTFLFLFKRVNLWLAEWVNWREKSVVHLIKFSQFNKGFIASPKFSQSLYFLIRLKTTTQV